MVLICDSTSAVTGSTNNAYAPKAENHKAVISLNNRMIVNSFKKGEGLHFNFRSMKPKNKQNVK